MMSQFYLTRFYDFAIGFSTQVFNLGIPDPTHADIKIFQYIHLHIKNSTTRIPHYNIFHVLRYAHFRYAKCLFTNIQEQWNTTKSSLLFKKRVNNSRYLRIQNVKCSGCYFCTNANIWKDFQTCISDPLSFYCTALGFINKNEEYNLE